MILSPSQRADFVAQFLIEQLGVAEGTGARPADIVAGYRIAADRVAAWGDHGSWPALRDRNAR